MSTSLSRTNPYWFQEEGYFDRNARRWVPFRPLPRALEPPGPRNFFDSKELAQYYRYSGLEWKATVLRWDRVLYPRLSRAARRVYIERRRRRTRPFREELWAQLTPIAGFTPPEMQQRFGVDDEFRLDKYGNVLAREAERFSPTAWDIDHIFPYSKGGLTQRGNLRAIYQGANMRKRATLEPLISAKALQNGTSLIDFQRLVQSDSEDDPYGFLITRQRRIRSELEDAHTQWLSDEAYEETLCDACFSTEALFECSGCRMRQYCSKECAEQEWPAHQDACEFSAQTMRHF